MKLCRSGALCAPYNKNKEGISLITLIITIIVIIILAAIVIFTGLRTPDSAQFSSFAQQVDNVQMAVTNKFADLKAKHAIAKEYRTDEQIYIEIATAVDPGQYASMGTTKVLNGDSSIATGSTEIQNIVADYSNVADGSAVQVKVDNGTSTQTLDKTATGSLGMTLPKVREYNNAWYVTKDGRVFNANGYAYNGKTYYDAKHYQEGEQGSNGEVNSGRALAVYNVIKADNITVTGAPEDGTATETLHTVTYNANGGTGEVASQTETSITLSDGTGLTAPEGKVFAGWNTVADGSGTAYTSGQVVSIDLNLYAQWGSPIITKATSSFNGIKEVEIDGDHFYVIGETPGDSTKVRLLAKYNLNQDGTAQLNDNYSQTACAFSTSKYWYDGSALNSKYGTGYPADLTVDSGSIGENDGKTALYMAQQYGIAKVGVAGTLMTKQQLETLKNTSTNWEKIVWGRYTGDEKVGGGNGNGWLVWWLGSVNNDNYVWDANGSIPNFSVAPCSKSNYVGVRPVIDVLASLVP